MLTNETVVAGKIFSVMAVFCYFQLQRSEFWLPVGNLLGRLDFRIIMSKIKSDFILFGTRHLYRKQLQERKQNETKQHACRYF